MISLTAFSRPLRAVTVRWVMSACSQPVQAVAVRCSFGSSLGYGRMYLTSASAIDLLGSCSIDLLGSCSQSRISRSISCSIVYSQLRISRSTCSQSRILRSISCSCDRFHAPLTSPKHSGCSVAINNKHNNILDIVTLFHRHSARISG